MNKIVLLSGKAESGKSTVANYIKQQLESQGKKVCIMRFAQYIKMYLKEYFQWDGVTKTPEIREMMQKLGTEKIREELRKPLFHCSRISEDIEILSDYFDVFILDDTRFLDEAYYLMAAFPRKVITVRIHRLDHESQLTPEQRLHRSETEMDNFKFDFNIWVQSGIDHLHDECDRTFKGILY